MARTHYERLSAMDYSFLASETPSTPMHVAGLEIFEAGPLRTDDGSIDVARIRAAYRAVLHRMPRYRQKLAWIPIEGRPVWVDDASFVLDQHLRLVSLPSPGGDAELKRLVSRLIEGQLDRSRPLWEVLVIEGLDRDRFALLAKTHHCMLDGAAGVEMAQLVLSTSREAKSLEPRPWCPRPAPTPGELLRDQVWHRAGLPLRALTGLYAFANETEDLADELSSRYRAMQEFVDASMSPSSATPLNGPLSPRRRFDWTSMSLDDVKAVRAKLGCTINDVFLAIATQALRTVLLEHELDLDELVFRAATPVSLRQEGERGAAGNRVASWFVRLPVGEPDRLAQVEAIREETNRLKESRQALGMDLLMATTELVPTSLLALAAGFASSAVNTIVTNVPGPQTPLYLQGARLLEIIPEVPLLPNIGLGLGLMTYNGCVFWGFTADADRVRDLDDFARRVSSSFAELAEAAGVELSSGETAPRKARPLAPSHR